MREHAQEPLIRRAPGDLAYPPALRDLAEPPALDVWGDLRREDALAIAVVGARRPTSYGTRVAETLARDLALRGITVVSGLARGIDTAAHRGALAAGGRTIAVLGSGIDRVYPPENRELAGEIAARGAVISQFTKGTAPLPWHFPVRNRIIAGLALGTVVVEAGEGSGALITANHAGDLGRLVFAVPGPVTSAASRGVHGLLRDGATLVRDWTDIVNELPAMWRDCVRVDTEPATPREMPSGDEAAVLMLLGEAPLPLERVIEGSRLGAGRTSAALVALEVKGLVRQTAGLEYVRTGV
jgi:DNA processing protein